MDMQAQYEFFGSDAALVEGQVIFLLRHADTQIIYPMKAKELLLEQSLFAQLNVLQKREVIDECLRQLDKMDKHDN